MCKKLNSAVQSKSNWSNRRRICIDADTYRNRINFIWLSFPPGIDQRVRPIGL
jgi:hypothetical protein